MKYIFRGIVILEYNPEDNQVKTPATEHPHGNLNFCRFIPEDYLLIAKFYETAHKHAIGEITDDDLEDIVVN